MSDIAEFILFTLGMIAFIPPFWGAMVYGEPIGWSWMFKKDD